MTLVRYNGLLMFSYDLFHGGFMRQDGKRIMGEYSVVGTKYCSHCKLRAASQFRHITMFPSLPGCTRLLCDVCSRLNNIPVHCSCGGKDTARLLMPFRSTIMLQDFVCRQCYQQLTQASTVLFAKVRFKERMHFGKRLMPAYVYGGQ